MMMEYEYYTSKLSVMKQQSIASRIPPEIFINICQYLPPIDLISLARVCKSFHGYLCSTDSFTTKEIWKNSRITFLPFVQMPPPEGMTELQYIKFISERGCQFCGKPRIRKIYWAFLVRCCKKCLEDRTIKLEHIKCHLFSQNSVPNDIDIVSGLTFINGSGSEKSLKHRPSNLYWIQSVHKAYNEFNELKVEERQEWIIRKREEGRHKMEEVMKRESEIENEYWSKSAENSRKRNNRVVTIDNLIKREINEYGFPRFKMSVVNKCLTYNKAMGSASTSPFTKRAWIGFRNKLLPEYLQMTTLLKLQRQEVERNLAIDVAIQTRQMDIIKMIFELLRPEIEQIQTRQQPNSIHAMEEDTDMERNSSSSSESNSDSDDSNYNSFNKRMRCNEIFESSLIKFLPWCPSFRNPPFTKQDPRNLWEDEFLMNVLIPQLREEARSLKNNPAPIKTVCGAFLHGGLHNKRIFKCKLCRHHDNNLNPPKLYSFYEIRLHLVKSIHKVRMINDDLMIEVVPSSINVTCNAKIFPRNKPDLFFAAGFNCNLICNLLS